ncbi:hypothetical protein F7725_011922 [Dissostichus mawsoni]|uniref:G-protein coupled receptors family 1 profile domain-containing protein n=1 Tax=Dissostichus mawsoni TaxID=36200 RepID=A0A7J5ZC56_DISMA|nr:hypothetical protein F7725_011922 [Dissostichus mawsoni]
MLQRNCSLTGLFTSGATVLSDVGCDNASVVCGMNISWVLANATDQDLYYMCLSEEEYLSMHLGPVRSPVFLPVCVTYLTIFMVGVLGNYLTCTVILRHRVMQTPTNYYLMSLAASDLLVLLLGMPLELYEMWQNYPFLLGEGSCYFKTFLFETVCFASILNVTALSVERYMAVVHPLKVKRMTTRAHVKRVIFMLWVLPCCVLCQTLVCMALWCCLHGLDESSPDLLSAVHVIKPTWVYNLIILISTLVFFLLPMMIISILYLIIGVRLRRHRLMTVVDTSFGPECLSRSHKQKLSRRNLQVTKMLCVLVIVFGLCWAPFHVDRLMWSYIDPSSEQHLQVFELVHIVSGVFFYLSSAINPILYNLMSTRFREMFSHVTCYHNSWPARFSQQMTQRSTLSEKMPSSMKST